MTEYLNKDIIVHRSEDIISVAHCNTVSLSLCLSVCSVREEFGGGGLGEGLIPRRSTWRREGGKVGRKGRWELDGEISLSNLNKKLIN